MVAASARAHALQRLLHDYAAYAIDFLAEPLFFTVLDIYGIELIYPRRQGLNPCQIGKKGISNGRWTVDVKLARLINDAGEVVDWTWDTANTPDNIYWRQIQWSNHCVGRP